MRKLSVYAETNYGTFLEVTNSLHPAFCKAVHAQGKVLLGTSCCSTVCIKLSLQVNYTVFSLV